VVFAQWVAWLWQVFVTKQMVMIIQQLVLPWWMVMAEFCDGTPVMGMSIAGIKVNAGSGIVVLLAL